MKKRKNLSGEKFIQLLTSLTDEENPNRRKEQEYLFSVAREVRENIYGKDVYVRGLIEFSNICTNNCYYCGIRKDNQKIQRYRLTPEEILYCAREGYSLGFRTFVLQGGEDRPFMEEHMEEIIRAIKKEFPDCAVTLSVGEWDREMYQCWKEAGADRYLLRHETAVDEHYRRLHPPEMLLEKRKSCLYTLRELGYEVGAGMMIGSPAQTVEHLLADIRFLQELAPHMIGVGPFLAHADTPFKKMENGSLEMTCILLGVLRLLFPKVLLPATTALATTAPDGREKGLLAGANVVMPNLSPSAVRKKYALYDNKVFCGAESAQEIEHLKKRVEEIGYRIVTERGDSRVGT